MSAAALADPGVVLPWDSEFFGFRIGRANGTRLTAEARESLLAWSAVERLRCLYLFADAEDATTLVQAHAGGFRFVDVRVDLALALPGPALAPAATAVRPASAEDLPALEAIARSAHHDTRFFKDVGFPAARVADLYARWIQRDFREHHILVTGRAGVPTGYVTCQIDAAAKRGRIGLIAVADAERGRGHGRALVQESLRWFAAAGCQEVCVATQASNVAAQRLYQSMGFRTHEAHATFHRWF